MQKIVRKVLLFVAALAGLAFSGCSSDSSSTPILLPPKTAKKATEISVVSNTGINSVAVGSEITLIAKGNGSVKGPYTWQITDGASFVTGPLVSGAETPLELEKQTSGRLVLRGKTEGTVKIKVSADELESEEYTLKIETLKVYITDDANGKVKQTKNLKLKAVTNGAVSATVYNWAFVTETDKASLEEGVTSSSINLSAYKAGTVTVKVTVKDGKGKGSDLVSEGYTVTIDPVVLTVTGQLSITAGKSTVLKVSNDAGFVPKASETDDEKKYVWSIKDSSEIISIEPSGNSVTVKGLEEGNETITVSLLGAKASVNFEVAPFTVTIPAETREVVSFGKAGLKVTATNNDGRTGNYDWKIKDGTGSASFAAVTGAEEPSPTEKKAASGAYVNVYGGKTGTVTLTAEKDGVTSEEVTINVTPFNLTITGSDSVVSGGTVTLTASSSNANLGTLPFTWALADGSKGVTLEPSSTTKTQTVKASEEAADVGKIGKVKVTAGGVTSEVKSLEIKKAGNVISASDTPIGFASIDAESSFGGYGGTVTTVTTKAELKSQLEDSTKRVIYVSGTIDLSEGLMPSTAGGSTTKLDDFVKKVTAGLNSSNSSKYPKTYSTYNAFKNAYAALCSSSTDDKSSSSTTTTLSQTLWALNKGYQGTTSSYAKMYSNDWNGVLIKPNSNKTLIGLDGATIKGGAISISGQSNIAIRNITFQDAYDPFPHHEKGDGFNAELDCVVIQGTCKNIWVDHCTFEDTMKTSKVTISGVGSEKWQTYDGLLDMKNTIKNITVSNTIIQNHDKCMLIGNDDSDGDNATRTISHIQNYYLNCGQRLPMVRNTRLHALNNVYDTDSNRYYTQQYAIGNRANALINAEGCYFGSGIKYSIKDTYGKFWMSGCSDNSSSKTSGSPESAKVFDIPYTYTPMTADEAKAYVEANAGAGKWTVRQ